MTKNRYTPLAQQLIAEFRSSGLAADDWIESVWQANPEESAPCRQLEPQVLTPEVMPDVGRVAPDDPLTLALMSVGAFVQQQQQQGRLLEMNQQLVDQLIQANSDRLAELQQFFLAQQQQRQAAQAQRVQQLQQEGQSQAIEEFMLKEQAKNQTLAQLESLNSLGKLIPQPNVADG